ncbi:MAG TPA: hypothetical protein PLD47_15220 [Aggregatilineales bacterium]|nr:hypothetical protein [Anaerolineales bacterium]HRE49077.1 hypothetical protein [Aggregatilineales bacterium]
MPIQKLMMETSPVMRLIVTDPWSLKEMWDALRDVHTMLDNQPNKVHLFFDLSKAKSMPLDMVSIARRPDIGHPKTDQLVFLGAGMMTRMMISGLARAQRATNVHFFDREGDALAFLAKLPSA